MSIRGEELRNPLQELGSYGVCLSAIFVYLGISIETSILASITWTALAASGGFVIQALVGSVQPKLKVLIAFGPGALFGLGLSVIAYLSVRGGSAGFVVVTILLICGVWSWIRSYGSGTSGLCDSVISQWLLLGAALLANSKEFPNLFISSLLLLGFGVLAGTYSGVFSRVGLGLLTLLVMLREILTRPEYWWWSSDDTTTLSGIGSMVIQRGRVDDYAGWSTRSHHWLLHAWLALWNLLSRGHIFETYMVAWPVVASLSLFASITLIIHLFLGRDLLAFTFAIVAAAVAGIVQLEWAAPQEQQPFVFGMVACCALSSALGRRTGGASTRIRVVRLGTLVMIVPAVLYLLKPTLLVAYLLLILGSILTSFRLETGRRLMISIAASSVAVVAGIAALALSSSRISQNSFTSITVDYLPADLGWCRINSFFYASYCVLSLQALLLAATLLAVLSLWMLRHEFPLKISLVVFLPMVIAYVPLRLFVSAAVFTGAPSFYRLSEMAMMTVVTIGLAGAGAALETKRSSKFSAVSLAVLGLVAVVFASRSPSGIYNLADSTIVKFPLTRYLNASDFIALLTGVAVAFALGRTKLFVRQRPKYLLAALFVVSLLPLARLAQENFQSDTEPIRLSRPAYLGPSDIEELGKWLNQNVKEDALIATNFLCPNDRIDECAEANAREECARREPVLMASWALAALSKREFLYLSQFWDNEKNYYTLHKISTDLGSEVSPRSLSQLKSAGVAYYVASRAHTNVEVWKLLLERSEFSTMNFVVVVLENVRSGV